MDSNTKGAVVEQAIVFAATKLHIPVLRPVAEHGRCDLGLEIDDRLWRVQCKWGRLSADGSVVIVNLSTCRYSPHGYVRTTYSEAEVDLFGVYCGELDRCFLLPAALCAGRRAIWLRLTPARNGQQSCINLASDFDFEGAIAQLGERRSGRPKVAGSSPASSISQGTTPAIVRSDDFRVRFSYWLDRVSAGEEAVVTYRGRPRVRLMPLIRPP
jgi:hypothetical protein